MKLYKKMLPVAVIGLGLILTGCGSQSSNQDSSTKSSATSSSQVQKNSSSSSSENSSNDSSNMTNDSKMPQTDQSVTKSVNDFTVNYNKSNQSHAQYQKKTYANSNEAQKHVGYRDANEDQGLPTINLGSNIKGTQESGAGQTYVNFHIGNWSISVHSSSNVTGGTTAQDSAKQIVSYLQDHSLPAPNSQGAINVNTNSDQDNSAKWQDNNSVYHLSAKNQNTLLQMATSIK